MGGLYIDISGHYKALVMKYMRPTAFYFISSEMIVVKIGLATRWQKSSLFIGVSNRISRKPILSSEDKSIYTKAWN